MPPEIWMPLLLTFGLILMPYAVSFTFFTFRYGEVGTYFKSSFDSSESKLCSTSQKYNLLLLLMVLFIMKILVSVLLMMVFWGGVPRQSPKSRIMCFPCDLMGFIVQKLQSFLEI